jgi:hypothetical protein
MKMDSNDTSEVKEVVEVKEAVEAAGVEVLDESQNAEVSGGADAQCGTTVTVGTGGINFQTHFDTLTNAMIGTYEGVVDVTSHVIERVSRAIK